MIPVTVCFAIGIILDRMLDVHSAALLAVGTIGWIAWLTVCKFRPKRRVAACCLLYLMIASSGALWHHARWNWFSAHEIGVFANSDSDVGAIRGTLESEPVRVAASPAHPTLDTMRSKDRIRFLLQVNEIRAGNRWVEAYGNARTSVFLSEAQSRGEAPIELPKCGQSVEIVGSLVGGGRTKNPGQFNFKNHFRAKSQLASVFVDSTAGVALTKNSRPDFGLGFRARIRASIDRQLHLHLPGQQAAFASAVLLGNRDQMDFAVRQRFLKTGASHLLAISGLHVGILASGFLVLLRLGFVSRRNCLYLAIAFVLSYAWLVEFRPTVLRASILICVMCGARLLGKTSLSWGSLMAALMLVLIVNPMDLFSLGAQLSFLAISTIIIGKPWIFQSTSKDPLDQLIARTRPDPVRIFNRFARDFRSAFCISFLIWVLGLPLVAYHFHSVALIAPLINPLLLLPMALALYSGIATIACGSVAPVTAVVPATVCSVSLASIQAMIDFGAAQPVSHFWSSGPSAWAAMVFYLGVFVFAIFPKTKIPVRWCVALGFAWLIFGWLVPDRVANLQRASERELRLTVIDVRHGSAALAQLPDGKNLLFDCGSLSGSNRAARTISEVLWREGVDRLDAIIVSHADVDHFNGLPELLNRFEVQAVCVNDAMASSDAKSVATFRESAQYHGVEVRIIGAGNFLTFGDGEDTDDQPTIEFLGPPSLPVAVEETLGDNELSLVACLQWQGRQILLPGDVEGLGLESLLKWPIEKVDVLVAAHHGSKNSDPERFARWCRPDYVIVSCGAGRFGSSESLAFQQGHQCEVMTTDQSGASRYTVDDAGILSVEHWNGNEWTSVNRL